CVAAAGEAHEPAPECPIKTRLDGKRRILLEQSLQRHANRAGRSQWQHVTGTDQAAVGVRAAHAELAAVNHFDCPAGSAEVMSARRSDHAATDNDYLAARRAHARMPFSNGSRGSRISVASAVTYASPRTVG